MVKRPWVQFLVPKTNKNIPKPKNQNHPLKIYSSLIFGMFRKLYKCFCNICNISERHPEYISNHSSFYSFRACPSPRTNMLLSVSVVLPTLDILYKWHYTVCDLLSLTSFIGHVFRIYPCCSMNQYIIFL